MHNEYTLTTGFFTRVITKVRITIATLTNAILINPKKSKQKNTRLSYVPVCWQCGTEEGLLKLHSSGVLYVCHSCGGEQ